MTAIDYDFFVRIAHEHFPSIIFVAPLVSPNLTRHYAYLGGNSLRSRLESDSERESNGLLVRVVTGPVS